LASPYGALVSFGIASPEVVFAKRHRRELGISAYGTDGDEFLDSAQARLLHQLDAHDEVFIKEAPGVLAIGADPADHGREMDDRLRPRLAHQARNRLRFAQVVIAGTRCGDVVKSSARQLLDHEAAEKARTAGDQDARVVG